jgi:hypothetical protein
MPTESNSIRDAETRAADTSAVGFLYLAEVLKMPVQELFPPRTPGNRIHDFIEKLETTRF